MFRLDMEEKLGRMQALEQRVNDEREMMASLGNLLDPGDAGSLEALSTVEYLTDPPFLAKTAIFARLCDNQVRGLVGSFGRLGRNHTKAERLAEQTASRLLMYVRNVLYGDVAALGDDERRRQREQWLAVARSQLGQDLAACTMHDLETLRAERGQEVNVLFLLAEQVMRQRYESERAVERLLGTLEELRSLAGSPPSSFVEAGMTRLLEQMAEEVQQLRRRLERTQGLVETVRSGVSAFVVAVHSGQPFQLSRPPEEVVAEAQRRGTLFESEASCTAMMTAAPVTAVDGSDEGSGEAEGHEDAQQQPHDSDLDVRFWLQLRGLLRYEEGLRGVRWGQLRQLGSEQLRQRGVGGSEPARVKLVQQIMALDPSDWFGVLYAGWMKKRGEGAKAAWRRRYFVLLSNKELLYFKTDSAQKPQGSFFLHNVVRVETGQGRQVLLHTKGRVYELEPEPHNHQPWLSYFSNFCGS